MRCHSDGSLSDGWTGRTNKRLQVREAGLSPHRPPCAGAPHPTPPSSLQRNNAPPWPVTTVREPLRRTHPSLKQLLRHKGKPPPDDNFHDIFGVTHYVKTSVNHRTLHKLGPGGSLDCFSPLTFLISPWTDGSSDNTAGLFFFFFFFYHDSRSTRLSSKHDVPASAVCFSVTAAVLPLPDTEPIKVIRRIHPCATSCPLATSPKSSKLLFFFFPKSHISSPSDDPRFRCGCCGGGPYRSRCPPGEPQRRPGRCTGPAGWPWWWGRTRSPTSLWPRWDTPRNTPSGPLCRITHTHTHNKKHISTKIQAKHGAIFYVIVQFFFSRREKCHSPLQIPHWTANCHPPLPVLFIWRKTSLRSLDEIYMAHRCRRNWRETQQLKV